MSLVKTFGGVAVGTFDVVELFSGVPAAFVRFDSIDQHAIEIAATDVSARNLIDIIKYLTVERSNQDCDAERFILVRDDVNNYRAFELTKLMAASINGFI